MSDPIRILYVDDDVRSLDIRASILEEEHGFDVHTESDVDAGLDYLQREQVDCILSDLKMPEMTGIEFLEAVREDDPHVPFILFTSQESEELAHEAFEAGATDYFPKSVVNISYELLAHRIKQAVARHRETRTDDDSPTHTEAVSEPAAEADQTEPVDAAEGSMVEAAIGEAGDRAIVVNANVVLDDRRDSTPESEASTADADAEGINSTHARTRDVTRDEPRESASAPESEDAIVPIDATDAPAEPESADDPSAVRNRIEDAIDSRRTPDETKAVEEDDADSSDEEQDVTSASDADVEAALASVTGDHTDDAEDDPTANWVDLDSFDGNPRRDEQDATPMGDDAVASQKLFDLVEAAIDWGARTHDPISPTATPQPADFDPTSPMKPSATFTPVHDRLDSGIFEATISTKRDDTDVTADASTGSDEHTATPDQSRRSTITRSPPIVHGSGVETADEGSTQPAESTDAEVGETVGAETDEEDEEVDTPDEEKTESPDDEDLTRSDLVRVVKQLLALEESPTVQLPERPQAQPQETTPADSTTVSESTEAETDVEALPESDEPVEPQTDDDVESKAETTTAETDDPEAEAAERPPADRDAQWDSPEDYHRPDDLEIEAGSSLLVQCSSQDDRKEAACSDLLGLAEVSDRNVLLVRYREIDDEHLFEVAAHANHVTLITIGYNQPVPEDLENVETIKIHNPNDLTRLGIVTTSVIEDWEETDNEMVLCFDPIDILFNYKSVQGVFRFLHIYLGRLRSADVTAHFHVDPYAENPQEVNSLKPLFDQVISIDSVGTHLERG